MTDGFLVSCIITTFGRKYSEIVRSITSVLKQNYKSLELILIDDNGVGSALQKDIEKNVRKVKGVKYIPLDGNYGAQVARNTGIRASRGELIAFLDDDDEWMSNKISEQVKIFAKEKDVGLIYCKGIYRNIETGEERAYIADDVYRDSVTYRDMLGVDYVGTTTQAMIPRGVFDRVGLFDESLPARQDYEMWLRISQKYVIRYVDDKLFVHNIHSGEQISKDPRKVIIGYKTILEKNSAGYRKYPLERINVLGTIRYNYHLLGQNILAFVYTVKILFYFTLAIFLNPRGAAGKFVRKLRRDR